MGLYTWWRKQDNWTSFGITSVAGILANFMPGGIGPGLLLLPAYLWEFFGKTKQTAAALGIPLLPYSLATISSYAISYSCTFIGLMPILIASLLGLAKTQSQIEFLGIQSLATVAIAVILATAHWLYLKPKSQREIIELLKKKMPKAKTAKSEPEKDSKEELRKELLELEEKLLQGKGPIK